MEKKPLIRYIFVNAGAVNAIWWFMFMFGTHITAKKADFFNDVIAPIFENVYSISVLLGLLSLIFGIIILRLSILWGRKIIGFGVGISIICPSLTAIYVILLFIHGKADIPNLTTIPMAIGISCFNFAMGKPIFKKPMKQF